MGGLKKAEGLCCPQCGQDAKLLIQMASWYEYANETGDPENTTIDEVSNSADGPFIWDGDSKAECPNCEFQARLRDFVLKNTLEREA